MAEEQFPSNSHSKKSQAARPEVKSVVKGGVRVKEKTVGDTFKNVVWGKYVRPALVFAVVSVALPAIKDMAEDAVTGMIRGAFNGGEYNRANRTKGGGNFINYSSFSKDGKKEEPRQLSQRARATHDFNELVLESRAEGDMILETLGDLIEQYGHAKVSDMYSLAGISGSFTDEKYGWFDLTGASVRRHHGGYLLAMPRTQPID